MTDKDLQQAVDDVKERVSEVYEDRVEDFKETVEGFQYNKKNVVVAGVGLLVVIGFFVLLAL